MDDAELKQYLDIDKALGRIRGNKKLLKTLLGLFLNTTPSQYEQLKQEIEAGDHEAAAKTVHAIKGAVANISMEKLYDQSVAVESLLRSASDAKEVFSSFSVVYETTKGHVEALLQSSFFD